MSYSLYVILAERSLDNICTTCERSRWKSIANTNVLKRGLGGRLGTSRRETPHPGPSRSARRIGRLDVERGLIGRLAAVPKAQTSLQTRPSNLLENLITLSLTLTRTVFCSLISRSSHFHIDTSLPVSSDTFESGHPPMPPSPATHRRHLQVSYFFFFCFYSIFLFF